MDLTTVGLENIGNNCQVINNEIFSPFLLLKIFTLWCMPYTNTNTCKLCTYSSILPSPNLCGKRRAQRNILHKNCIKKCSKLRDDFKLETVFGPLEKSLLPCLGPPGIHPSAQLSSHPLSPSPPYLEYLSFHSPLLHLI
jgi:hypothetical protein